VASHYDVEANEIDVIEGYGAANSGSSSQYSAMRNYMESGSLAPEDRYAPSGQTTELIQLHHPEVPLVRLKAIFTPQ
jgi:hypothetical protein